MRGYTSLKQRWILPRVFISACMLITFASGLSELPGSSSAPLPALTDNSALVPAPLTASDELNGAKENSGDNDKQSTGWSSVASLFVPAPSILYFDSLFARIQNLSSIPGKQFQPMLSPRL